MNQFHLAFLMKSCMEVLNILRLIYLLKQTSMPITAILP